MIDFNDEAKYKAYFEAIATSHVDIDSFLYGNEDIGQASARSGGKTGRVLWLDYYPVRTATGQNDNFVGVIKAAFTIMGVPSDKKYATKQAYYKACEDIVQQILAKINYDFQTETQGYGNEPEWTSLQFGAMQDTQLGSTIYTGCACELDFTVPLKMEYDETKWS